MTTDNNIIKTIESRMTQHENGDVWITQGLQTSLKEVVRAAKRQYDGSYKVKPKAKTIFWPYTKSVVDNVVSNTDLDLKDIQLVPAKDNYRFTGLLASEFLRKELKEAQYGLLMNEASKRCVVDGTVVIRTTEIDGKPVSTIVDLENFDTNWNVRTPDWFCERILINKDSIPDHWNKEAFTQEASQFKDLGLQATNSVAYKRFEGYMPKWWVTKVKGDTQPVWGMLKYSNGEGNTSYIHERKILGKSRKDSTYDYAQFTPETARFLGVGIPEALRDIQAYFNMMINNRVERAAVASKGILIASSSANLSPDVLSHIGTGSVVTLPDVNQLKQLPVQDVSGVSFNEEASLNNMGDRLTGSTEISRGQIDRSGVTLGQTQTEAAFSSTRFQYHKEQMAFLHEKVVKKWYNILINKLNEEEYISILDDKVRTEVSRELAQQDMAATLKNAYKKAGVPGLQLAQEMFSQDAFFEQRYKDNKFKLTKKRLQESECYVDISVGTESKDTQQLVSNLIQVLPMLDPQRAEAVRNKIMDSVGLTQYSI